MSLIQTVFLRMSVLVANYFQRRNRYYWVDILSDYYKGFRIYVHPNQLTISRFCTSHCVCFTFSSHMKRLFSRRLPLTGRHGMEFLKDLQWSIWICRIAFIWAQLSDISWDLVELELRKIPKASSQSFLIGFPATHYFQ